MNVLSLFDGISGGQQALNNLRIKIKKYYSSEVDKFAQDITRKNFPNTVFLGEVQKVNTKNLKKIDLLIGGSPCQGFSFAGKKKGAATKSNVEITTLKQYFKLKKEGFEFEGQSYLFWEYIRILEELKKINPNIKFLLENVKMPKKWEDIITKTIGVEPIKINSNLLSAQNRQRLYWTNISSEEIKEEEIDTTTLKDIVEPEETIDIKYQLSLKHYEGFIRHYKWKPNQLDEKSKPLLASYYKQPPYCPYIPFKKSSSGYRRLIPLECERLQKIKEGYTKKGITEEGKIYNISDTQRYKSIGNGWTISVINHLFKNLKNEK